MALFTKGDMKYTYTWTTDTGDNPKLKGEPDSSLLDRNEGYEVLYLIQKLMVKWGKTSTTEGQKIERMIKAAPSSTRTQEGVKEWVRANWGSY